MTRKKTRMNDLSPQHLAGYPPKHGLYDPAYEKDSCGVGFVAHIKGQRSHQIILDADQILRNMDHRGACGCDADSGDGAGMLTALPHTFLTKVAQDDLNARLPEPGRFAAGIVFLPTDVAERTRCKQAVEAIVAEQGQQIVGWRTVPVGTDVANIGPTARASAPHIEQLFVAAGRSWSGDSFERQLYLIRKRASHRLRNDPQLHQRKMFYICSQSTNATLLHLIHVRLALP